jgi:hypothetical protein
MPCASNCASDYASDGSVVLRRTEDMADLARKWAAETALAQGLPVKISDPLVLRRVAEILASNKPASNQADSVRQT